MRDEDAACLIPRVEAHNEDSYSMGKKRDSDKRKQGAEGGKARGHGKSKSKAGTKKKAKRKDPNLDIEAGSPVKDEDVHQNRFLPFIVVVKTLTVFSAINMIIGQVVGGLKHDDMEFIPATMRIYVVLFSSLVIANELGLGKKMMHGSAAFSNWVIRGAFYAFIGVVGLEQNSLASQEKTNVYLTVVAWFMVGVGVLYAVMGALCLQVYYDRHISVEEVDQHNMKRRRSVKKACKAGSMRCIVSVVRRLNQ